MEGLDGAIDRGLPWKNYFEICLSRVKMIPHFLSGRCRIACFRGEMSFKNSIFGGLIFVFDLFCGACLEDSDLCHSSISCGLIFFLLSYVFVKLLSPWRNTYAM